MTLTVTSPSDSNPKEINLQKGLMVPFAETRGIVSSIKKGSAYFSIQYVFRDGERRFRNLCDFTGPLVGKTRFVVTFRGGGRVFTK